MAAYSGWTLLWTFLGFCLLFAGTARDSWTQTADRDGSLIFDETTGNVIGGSLQKSFGTLDYKESFQFGYGYGNPDVCHSKARRNEMQELSSAMIALLLLSNGFGFFASLFTVLAATESSIMRQFKNARVLAIAAAVFCLITWIVWLAVGDEKLANKFHDAPGDSKPDNLGACRFNTSVPFSGSSFNSPASEWVSVGSVNNTPAASFGLCVVAFILYLLLAGSLGQKVKAQTLNPDARITGTLPIVFLALAAMGALFAASVYNIWTHGTNKGSSRVEDNLDNFIAFDNSTGTSDVVTETRYGVYSAVYFQQHTLNYNDKQNRAYMCAEPLEDDDAGRSLVHGGRITLGFTIVAAIFALVATVAQIQTNPKAFWISVFAFIWALLALIVWSIINDYIIKDRCCDAPYCELGDSFSLVAAGAFFLLVAIFYQAWVISDDIYVLHPPHAYGMAAEKADEGAPMSPITATA